MTIRNDVQSRIIQILNEKIRPSIESHGGDVSFMNYEDGVVTVRLTGACAGCPSADLETRDFIESALCAECPEVKDVVLDRSVNQELLDFARTILNGQKRVEY